MSLFDSRDELEPRVGGSAEETYEVPTRQQIDPLSALSLTIIFVLLAAAVLAMVLGDAVSVIIAAVLLLAGCLAVWVWW